ncbi:hypothetical protein [Luteimonas salinilitoris]|uniref:Uncharacterized protein n=1 Tax=Luteimonas salinilitoris TaxID=3237697 RepID=A0ABV4HJX5_9GAMM
MQRRLWPLGVFVAAFLGGSICAALAARVLLEAHLRQDSMLYQYLSRELAQGDVTTRLSTIEAAQRGELDDVIRLNCIHLKRGIAQLSIVREGAREQGGYEELADRAGAVIDALEAQGKCGMPPAG